MKLRGILRLTAAAMRLAWHAMDSPPLRSAGMNVRQ